MRAPPERRTGTPAHGCGRSGLRDLNDIDHVAIVGGGFSGTLQAINLLRQEGPRVTLIEKRAEPGLGVAYGEASPDHLLNVRAKNMNALPDDADGLVRWLAERKPGMGPDTFVPRLVYGEYLRSLLDTAQERYPDRLTILHDTALSIARSQKGVHIALKDGERISADIAILAVGNLPPHDPAGFGPDLPARLYRQDPWADAVGPRLSAEDTILLLGTGLTMVDTALRLQGEGYGGRIVALSRRGLVPQTHAEQPGYEPISDRPPLSASGLLASVRERSREIGWRNAVDELRPFTTSIWRAANRDTQARFLRHLRPWWDVHRHRLAPQVAQAVASMMETGQLTVKAGKTVSAEPTGERLRVTVRLRGETEMTDLTVNRAINCTGPQGNLLSTDDPLLADLVACGIIRPDPLRIGIDVDARSRVIGENGKGDEHIYAIGPMTRGSTWEIVAVPDIRKQVWALARRLCNAHWVGGEGL